MIVTDPSGAGHQPAPPGAPGSSATFRSQLHPAAASAWQPVPAGIELLQAQVAGLAAWCAEDWQALRLGEVRASDYGATGRRQELRTREQWSLDHLLGRRSSEQLLQRRRPTIVLAHHREDLLRSLAASLTAAGAVGHATCRDAALALAAVVASQPDVLLLSEILPGAPGWQLLVRARVLSPRTTVVVHADDPQTKAAFQELGAVAVFKRATALRDLHQGLADLLSSAT